MLFFINYMAILFADAHLHYFKMLLQKITIHYKSKKE